jgi:hypothetical protein
MARPAPLSVKVSKVVDVDAQTLYDLVADITRMPTFSPETFATEWLEGATSAEVGARFKGTNRIGKAKWSTKPTVTVATRGREFSFKVPHGSGPLWTYNFDPVEGGTRVTESMTQQRPSPAIIRFIQRRNGVTDRAANLRSAMTLTLDRLAEVAGDVAKERAEHDTVQLALHRISA